MAPSIALCRVPELELASRLEIKGRMLDHCCGDGVFSSMAWGDRKMTAGCDFNPDAVAAANEKGIYDRLDVCDVCERLPYDDEYFDLVFNNSALEHLKDLDGAILEIARVLVSGGRLVFNVLNHRYFEWWPLSAEDERRYRDLQPFIHALDLEEWIKRLGECGLDVVSVDGYFGRSASRELARLDSAFGAYYIGNIDSALAKWYRARPRIMSSYWRWRLSSLDWGATPSESAGYHIIAVKK